MWRKIFAFIIAVLIFAILVAVGAFGTNLFMKYFVGHNKNVVVPKLLKLDLLSAQVIARKNNFYVSVERMEYSKSVENGRVISQNPRAGMSVKKFRTISVIISKGSKTVRVPQLDNLTLPIAENKLENLGLEVGKISRRFNSRITKNRVISTQPRTDEPVELGTKIDIVISLGKFQSQTNTNSRRFEKLLD